MGNQSNRSVRRTGVSTLTDSELTILDIAALNRTRRRQYRDAVFREQWNRPSHGLDDESLVRTLHRFEVEGWITSQACYDRKNRPDRTVRLTELGGALWESERLPDWDRYVSNLYLKNRISIYGYSAETCQRYFQIAQNAGMFQYGGGRVRQAVAHRQLIYWRPAQPVHLLSAVVLSAFQNVDWTYFESHRSWWRFAHEIGSFWDTDPNVTG